jgi:hypothetical protein
MKKVLLLVLEFARSSRVLRAEGLHDDSLRANQPQAAVRFSFWRALVS